MLLFQTDSLELNELRSVPVTRRLLLLSAYSYKQGTQRNHLSDPQWSLIQSLVIDIDYSRYFFFKENKAHTDLRFHITGS